MCSNILRIQDLKLKAHKGNLSSYVEKHPDAMSFFSFKASKSKMSFPQPGFLEGVKSKGKPLMKMANCEFTYPGNQKPTIVNITCMVSLASRVACVGQNGAGKSTMIKVRSSTFRCCATRHGMAAPFPLPLAVMTTYSFPNRPTMRKPLLPPHRWWRTFSCQARASSPGFYLSEHLPACRSHAPAPTSRTAAALY